MADYDSALPVRGDEKNGNAVDSERTGLMTQVNDGTNYRDVKGDSTGRPNVAGQNADGDADEGNPVRVAGHDNTSTTRTLLTDADGRLFVVNAEDAGVDESNTYASTNLVKNTATTVVSYTPAGDEFIDGFSFSGSGLTKVEVMYGTTGSEAVFMTLFNSTANPNVSFTFPKPIDIAATQTFKLRCTNKEPSASPSSDFTGYGTIFSHA